MTTLSTWQTEGTLVATISNIDLGSGGGWYNVDIADFDYSGGNLMVSVRTQNAPYTSPHSYWRYTSTSTYLSLLGNSDGTNPPDVYTSYSRPNITFVGIDVAVWDEPTNHVTDFAAGTLAYTSIQLNWTGSTGAQLPGNYLIQAIKSPGTYAAVADGTPVANDAVWTDNNAAINVAHVVGANTYTFTGLTANTAYEFKIWPYTNSLAAIDFKTDGTIPTVNASTLDPTQALDYSQDFNSGTSLPAINWTGDMSISSTHGNAGTNGLYKNLYSYTTTTNAVTPPIGPMTDDCQILFDYRIVNYSGYPSTGTTLGASDKIEVQVSTDNGANFTTIYTIDSTNHVTSNAFATLNLPVTAYDGDIILVKFLSTWGAGDYYVDIDNVIVRETPLAGILTVSPNPVECGNGYVGFDKNVQVSLTNTGVAAFIVSTIALEDYTNFDLADLPTLPVTINPGDPAVTFTVVFNPTVAGALTTNLLINDTRLNSSIVVNGTGVDPLVGEICENPYLATLPLVDYAGTTAGYANDYTSAMFTGLGSTSYVGGKDWVAKITVPADGWLDVSLADQTGYSSQWMGVFLVNTIPSLASPAAVLAQATGSSGPQTITDAVVAAGDYYVIVDNWPSPADIYFVLNVSFEAVTSAPNPANLVSPLDDAINVPLTQTLNWSSGGGYVEGYRLSFGTVDPYAVIVNDVDLDMLTTYDPTLAYGTEYWWTVTPYNYLGDATPITEWSFTTMADPTVIIPPDYLTNFETWPATNWSQMNYLYGGTPAMGGSWLQDDWLNVTSPVDKAAKINIYSTHNSWLVTPPIQVPGGDYVLEFDLALMVWSSLSTPVTAGNQADDRLLLVMSDNADMSSPTTLMEWNNTGSSNVFDNISPTGETISYPLAGITGTKHFAWYAESITDTAGDNDLMVNNVMIRIPPTAPEAPLLVYPGTDATDLPKTGFDLSWQNNPLGLEPDYFVVYMWTDAQGEFGGPFWETADASVTTLNPTVVIPEGETEPLTFAYDERWNWTVSAVVGTTEVIADSRWFVIQSDPTNYDYPYEEPFDEIALGALPEDWTLIDYSGGWQAAENIGPYSLPYAATIYYNSTLAKDDWMITLPMYMEESTLYNVSFMLKAPGWDGTPEALALHVGDAPTVAAMTAGTTLYDNNALEVADWINVTVPFTPAADGVYYFGWHAYSVANVDYIAVDDVMIFIPEDVDLAATGISGDGGGFVGSPVSTTVTVSNLGTTGQSSYTVYVKDAADDSILDQFEETVELGSLDSRDHVLSWTPTVDGTISIYGEVVVTGDANLANNTTGTMDVVVFTATTVLAYVGDPATTWVSSAYPFDMYYEDFVAETIYLSSEMMMTSGTINALAYYNYFDAAHTRPVQIWMKNTDANDLAASWLDWTGYVPVFDGDLVGPAGFNEIIIPITPFTYTGGNLAIRTSRTWQGEWTSGKQWLITDNLNYTNRTRFYREDSEFVDHTAPVGGTTSNYVPNILFILDPATPITSIAAPEITISNVGSDVSVDWDLVPYAYSYEVYTSDDPYVFGTVPGYTVYTNNLTVTPGVDDVREFFKVTSATYRTDYRGSVANRPVLAAKEGKLRSADAPAVPKVRARLSK
ncbi:MAG: choice-of-anchor J domain-containing protein [Candidatus Cloacimonetes bacterium]|nr:choice-of-anchor J domain-containing protein [Candidatus Cloacimonadota bacterium]MDY0367380.1 choice-of-anchor J domain-containing protein [Candidatus Syntrophosphaera sp.]